MCNFNKLNLPVIFYALIIIFIMHVHTANADNELILREHSNPSFDINNSSENREFIDNITHKMDDVVNENMIAKALEYYLFEILYNIENIKAFVFETDSDEHIIKILKRVFKKKDDIHKQIIDNGNCNNLSYNESFIGQIDFDVYLLMDLDEIISSKNKKMEEKYFLMKFSKYAVCEECNNKELFDEEIFDECRYFGEYGSISSSLFNSILEEIVYNYCSVCDKETKQHYSEKINQLPKLLNIEYGKFRGDNKIHLPHSIKKDLDLTKYLENEEEPYKYELSGALIEKFSLEGLAIISSELYFITSINGKYYKIKNGVYIGQIEEHELFEKNFGFNSSVSMNESYVVVQQIYKRVNN